MSNVRECCHQRHRRASTCAYDDLGRRTSLTRGNGTTTSYTYDQMSRLASLNQDLAGTTSDLSITSFAYNPANQITGYTRSNDLEFRGHGIPGTQFLIH